MPGISLKVVAVAGAAILGSAVSAAAQGPEKEPFTDERFETLQEQDALILLDVFAVWCPTCAMQQQVLADFQTLHPYAPVHILTIDFDSQKRQVTRFGAPRQSTLILYRGTERLWFSVAETRPAVIHAALLEALQ